VDAVERLSEDLPASTRGAVLTRGLGRSYGDASLPPAGAGPVTCSRLADRLISFDSRSGLLRAEAGFALTKLNRLFLSRLWATPVSPGTQQVTLGGMVASDVHGKNHHVAGCFGEHVRSLTMRVADGRVIEVSEQNEAELFRATLGGMGLTGHILEVEVQLERIPSPWILQELEIAPDHDTLVARLREASRTWPFTVAWMDSLGRRGRGVVIKGRWAEADEAPAAGPRPGRMLNVPFELPRWLLNRQSMGAFNELWFRRYRWSKQRAIVDPQSFFYPLDVLGNWNRLYGERGFTQYQCVLPESGNAGACRTFFNALRQHGGRSYLTILKDCGKVGRGMLSFPHAGMSVALDIPMEGPRTQELVDALNRTLIDLGGRIYLAKDALTRPAHFREMDTRLARWQEVRRSWDPDARLVSAQSVRLFGDVR
jgi:decaprenylphospho-beta-D-ribofuranose 2-oxidase